MASQARMGTLCVQVNSRWER